MVGVGCLSLNNLNGLRVQDVFQVFSTSDVHYLCKTV